MSSYSTPWILGLCQYDDMRFTVRFENRNRPTGQCGLPLSVPGLLTLSAASPRGFSTKKKGDRTRVRRFWGVMGERGEIGQTQFRPAPLETPMSCYVLCPSPAHAIARGMGANHFITGNWAQWRRLPSSPKIMSSDPRLWNLLRTALNFFIFFVNY